MLLSSTQYMLDLRRTKALMGLRPSHIGARACHSSCDISLQGAMLGYLRGQQAPHDNVFGLPHSNRDHCKYPGLMQ